MDIYSLSNITKTIKPIDISYVYAFNRNRFNSYYAKIHTVHLIFQTI